MRSVALCVTLSIITTAAVFAQDIAVNRQNKTIAVTADGSVTVDAEIAVVEIGCHNYALTKDAAFQSNVRVADDIIKALLASGIPKANIETEKLNLQRVESNNQWNQEIRKERQFEAQQSWHVSVPVAQAQGAVDLAVRTGANDVEDVDWNVD